MEIWRLNTLTTRILSSQQLMLALGVPNWTMLIGGQKVTILDLTEPSLLKLYLQAVSASPLEVCRYRYQESVVWLPSRCSASQCRIICLSASTFVRSWQVCAVSLCSTSTRPSSYLNCCMPHRRGGGLPAWLTGNVSRHPYDALFGPDFMHPTSPRCLNSLKTATTNCLTISGTTLTTFYINFCQTRTITHTIFDLADILNFQDWSPKFS